MIHPLEEMRRKLQELVGDAKQAMVATGAPTKLKTDSACPFFYQSNSWSSEQRIPWTAEDKRIMRPDEWIYSQAQVINKLTTEVKKLKDTVKQLTAASKP